MSLRALRARYVDVADAGPVGAAGVRGKLSEHDEVEGVLFVCLLASVSEQANGRLERLRARE